MGDPALYPEIRTARFVYAMQRLPRDFTADVQSSTATMGRQQPHLPRRPRPSSLPIFITMILTFVGILGPPIIIFTCAA
eukprot:scaffold21802_cov132-Isochrysis_galbana.AAC.1